MKKKMLAIVVVAGLALAGTASANWMRGERAGHHGQEQRGMMYQQLDQATQDKINKFTADNESLRKQMLMKRAEKRAIFSAANPDSAAVAKVTGELFELSQAMREKAVSAGIYQYVEPHGTASGNMGGGRGGGGGHWGGGHF